MTTGEWFLPLEPRPAARNRLVVFPHAGGGVAALAELLPEFPGDTELWSVNLPGRQARLAEPPRTDLEPLVLELADDLAKRSQAAVPFALFGYCTGALLAYLVARRLDQIGAAPTRLLVGSFAAPDIARLERRLHLLPSGPFWDRLIEFGGVPPELAVRTELRPVLEPGLRGDFALFAGYRHVPAPPMNVPITVLHGAADGTLGRGALLGWRRQSTRRPVLREIDASHWLVQDAAAEVAAAISADLP